MTIESKQPPRCYTTHGFHRFEARYDENLDKFSVDGQISEADLKQIADALKTKTYVHDVCTTCGLLLKRS